MIMIIGYDDDDDIYLPLHFSTNFMKVFRDDDGGGARLPLESPFHQYFFFKFTISQPKNG